MKKISLSKTQYMEGLRCQKLLWLRFNRPELAEPIDAPTAHLFSTGHRIEEYARQLYPSGEMIEKLPEYSFSDLIEMTEKAVTGDAPSIYEGTFAAGQMHCRTDILEKVKSGSRKCRLSEIKMCTKLKDELHIEDTGFQCRCLTDNEIDVRNVFLVHVNPGYTRMGELNPTEFFVSEEITKEALAESETIPLRVHSMIRAISQADPGESPIGSQCKSPGRCPFFKHCHQSLPENSIFELPYAAKVIPMLRSSNILRLVDIPLSMKLTPRQSAQVKSAKTGLPVIDRYELKAFLKTIEYPIYFLDFEAISPCIPPYDKCNAYERLPFQYSLHVKKSGNCCLEHYEYLHDTASDPRTPLTVRLLNQLGKKGTILAWNMSYEVSVLKAIANRFPEYSTAIADLLPRFRDLIAPFRSGFYVDFRFKGSSSLKYVLPVLVPSLSYKTMAIQKGDEASLIFEKYVEGEMAATEWEGYRSALLAYCELDTLAMAEILNVLRSAV
jgi:hypothetical protein